MSTTASICLKHRPDLQGLRAVAVMLVLLAHLGIAPLAGGFIGVDVFFVLSGYLITGILIRQDATAGRIQLLQFWTRRLRRLFPALAVMLLTVFLAAQLLLGAKGAWVQTASLGFAATWTSNLYFALADFDYFSKVASADLFLHTWSLGVEEQFYLVWPFILAIGLYQARRFQRSATRKLVSSAILALAACCGALAIAYWPGGHSLFGFYMMPARMFQFATGALVFLWTSHADGSGYDDSFLRQNQFLAKSLTVLGMVMIVGSAALISPHVKYPNLTSLFPTLGAAFVILSGSTVTTSPARVLLENQIAVWIGDRSYSIYLWHWPILQFGYAYQLIVSPVSMLVAACIAICLAAVSYRYIELPFWKGTHSSLAPARFVAASAVIACIAIAISVSARQVEDLSSGRLADNAQYRPGSDLPEIYGRDFDCDSWHTSSQIKPCVLAGDASERTVLLIGDSIGAQWVSALPRIYPPEAWKSVVLTKSACPMVDQDYYYDAVGDVYTVCTTWREAVLEFISQTSPEVLIIGSSSHYEFSEEEWIRGLHRVVSRVHDAVGTTVLLAGTPTVTIADPRCALASSRLYRFLDWNIPDCNQLAADSKSQAVAEYLSTVAERYTNVRVLNLNDLVCPNQQCARATEADVVVFRDDRHLTNRFVLTQVPEIRARLHLLGVAPMESTASASTSAD